MSDSLELTSKIKSYQVHFQQDDSFLDELAKIPHRALVVDAQVRKLHPGMCERICDPDDILEINAVEEVKTLESVGDVYRFMMRKSAKRNATIISIGGGIIQDITGFAAATLYRGINWVFLPATFLAQTDSCIGSKTSLNFESYKNILGGFYPPDQIHIWPQLLTTLPERDFYSGVGEVVKFQLLTNGGDPDVDRVAKVVEDVIAGGERLLQAIRSTMAVKIHYMTIDEFDVGPRNLLNYGHCFGHALESASKYAIPHGLAVNIGMLYANIAARERGELDADLHIAIRDRLLLPNLKVTVESHHLNRQVLLDSMLNDKKRVGEHLTLVAPATGFKLVKHTNFTVEEFHATLDLLTEELNLEKGSV